jgi:uncharacterized protein with LGFP repeats
VTDGSVRYRDFTKGRLVWTTATDVKELEGNILAKYNERDLLHSAAFGAPTIDETSTPAGGGRYNHFAGGGSIYWTSTTGAHPVSGGVKDRWRALDWERSYLGFPAADPAETGTAICQNFQGGSVSVRKSDGVVTDSRSRCA